MVALAGEVRGIDNCAACRDEVLTLEELMYEQSDLITMFVVLGYKDKIVEVGDFVKKKYREIELIDCHKIAGKFLFQQNTFFVYNMKVTCND